MITKTRYCMFTRCEKALWLRIHHPEYMEEDMDSAARMETGQKIGELARNWFGEHKVITETLEDGFDLMAMVEQTAQEMESGADVICEAAFYHEGTYCLVDILKREDDGWAIYEVKSSTSVKDEHITDVAFQKYVLECCGIQVTGVYVICVNNQYVFDGELDVHQFLKVNDVHEQVLAEQDSIETVLQKIPPVLESEDAPMIKPSKKTCNKPYKCSFWNWCTKDIPEENLYKFSPDHIDPKQIRSFLDQLYYPLYFLDFETVQPAIPRYIGTRPYAQIPFQYSLHYIEEEGGELKHKEFLAEPGTDPRRACAERLCEDIPMDACVTAYNKSFECTRLKELTETYPDLAEHLMNISEHIVDLIVPFRKGWYHLWTMKDSNSIKSVLPALYPEDPELDYHNLTSVHNGSEAMQAFPSMERMSKEDKEKMRTALLKYCELDTYAMVKVWEKLKEACDANFIAEPYN